MPKVSPLGSADMKRAILVQRENSDKAAKEADACLRKQIDILRVEASMSYVKIARTIGMDPATFYSRIKSPRSFKLYELRKLQSFAKQYGKELIVV